jgi:hypothetical protein
MSLFYPALTTKRMCGCFDGEKWGAMPRGGCHYKPAAYHEALTPLVVDWLLRNSETSDGG